MSVKVAIFDEQWIRHHLLFDEGADKDPFHELTTAINSNINLSPKRKKQSTQSLQSIQCPILIIDGGYQYSLSNGLQAVQAADAALAIVHFLELGAPLLHRAEMACITGTSEI
jgi:hypothetical protein